MSENEDQKKIRELLEKQEAREVKKDRDQKRAGILALVIMSPFILLLGTCFGVALFGDSESETPTPRAEDVAAAADPCRSRGRVEVSREQFGDRWPLTIERGQVWCVDCLAAIFRDPVTNTLYGLNGFAKSRGAEEIRPIWRDDPEAGFEGIKVDIGVLIDFALQGCR